MISELQRLQRLFRQLPKEQQQTLLAYAEFLHARLIEKPPPSVVPQILPRPDDESVIAAIKRLAKSYPMLDKASMLNETSRLMTEHILQGRASSQVIDDLEAIFKQNYQEFLRENTT